MTTSTQLIEEGKQLITSLKFTAAGNRFQNALNNDPQSVDARTWLARLRFLENKPQEGSGLIEEAFKIQPQNPEVLALKGVVQMQNKDWARAVEYLEQARKIDPALEMIYFNLAKSQRELGNLEAAETAARKAIELDESNYQAHSELGYILAHTGRLPEAIKEMARATQINPLFIKGYLVLGQLQLAAGNASLALKIYRQGVARNPFAFQLRERLASLHAFRMEFDQAYRHSVFIAVRRNGYGDWLNVGVYAVALGKFEKAEKAFKKALEVNPDGWEAHYNLGDLYAAARLNDKAKKEYVIAIEKDGKSFKPFNGIGLLLLKVENNPQEATKYFLRAIELAPTQKEPMLNMALTCANVKDWQNAEKFALAALRLSTRGDSVHQQAERLMVEIRKALPK